MIEINKRIEALEAELHKLKNEFKNGVDPKFEVGKWYKNGNGQTLLCYQGVGSNHFGFNASGEWSNRIGNAYNNSYVSATHQEVEEALKRQAIKMGFKEGVRFKTVERKGIARSYNTRFKYDKMNACFYENETVLLNNGDSCIFCNGVWAEIVKDEPIKIGSYKVEKIEHGGLQIGCKKMNIEQVLNIKNFMDKYKFSKVSFDGVETDLETINKILAL